MFLFTHFYLTLLLNKTKQKLYKENFAMLAARFLYKQPFSTIFYLQNSYFWTNLHYVSGKVGEVTKIIFHIFT
jgi:hypothetical protein